jgi:hypothetical protein
MDIKKALTILLLLFFVNLTSFAQKTTTINGTIRDANTNEALPFVNIFFIGTSDGTTSSIEGKYTIETTENVDSISFSFLGYNSKQFKIKKMERTGNKYQFIRKWFETKHSNRH